MCAGGSSTAPWTTGPGDPAEGTEGPAARRTGWSQGDGPGRPPANWLALIPDSAAATAPRRTPSNPAPPHYYTTMGPGAGEGLRRAGQPENVPHLRRG